MFLILIFGSILDLLLSFYVKFYIELWLIAFGKTKIGSIIINAMICCEDGRFEKVFWEITFCDGYLPAHFTSLYKAATHILQDSAHTACFVRVLHRAIVTVWCCLKYKYITQYVIYTFNQNEHLHITA